MCADLHPAGSLGTLRTVAGSVTFREITAREGLDPLALAEDLGAYCRYRSGGTAAMLRRVVETSAGCLMAAIAGDKLVGFLALFRPGPEERWGQGGAPGLLELGALEVDRAWRRQGIARALLQVAFGGGLYDGAIVVAPQTASDWDLDGTGLSPRGYQQLILRLFRRQHFAEFVTDDPLLAADPRSFLLARIGEQAAPGLYQAFRDLLTQAPAPPRLADAARQHQYFGTGFTTIRQINQLPVEEREAIYRRLIPGKVVDLLGLDLASGLDGAGNRLVSYVCPEDQGFVRIEVRHPRDGDYVFLLKLAQPTEEFLEIAFIIVNDPAGERFDVDRDPAGNPVGILAGVRNPAEELRAMRAGLAPGQVRRGLRALRQCLPQVEGLAAELGKEQVSMEALYYHHAILYERYGFGYLTGRERMEEIHRGFQPDGLLTKRLDGSTPFRMPEAARTIRGRSWAIHDGILGERWRVPRLYKIVGQAVTMPTFPDGVY